ncbi:MAG: 50S ribosomal protein L11 methyltransferase, partial [Chromatiaceae bacterium]|nr:50S ribosomal protein L11 methyltransferase [Candidatus Thioaporhodococcus sediminis]
QAVQASRDNADNNGVVVRFGLPDSLGKEHFDVLVANILTNPLKALAPLLASRVRPGGRIALSGILEAQAEEVMAIYGKAFEMGMWATEEGWVCLAGVRRC